MENFFNLGKWNETWTNIALAYPYPLHFVLAEHYAENKMERLC